MFSALAFLHAQRCAKILPLQIESLQKKQKLSSRNGETKAQIFRREKPSKGPVLAVLATFRVAFHNPYSQIRNCIGGGVMKSLLSFVAMLLLAHALLAQTQPSEEKVEEQGFLKLGEAQQRTLAPGTVHVWGLLMKKGQFVAVEVVEKSINTLVRVTDSNGAHLSEFDNPGQIWGTEKATWVAMAEGISKVEITSASSIQPGDYEITVIILRDANKTDWQTVEADSLNNLAQTLYVQGNYDEAELLFKRSLEILEKTLGQNYSEVASSLNNLAELYQAQGKHAQAEPLFKRSLAIRERNFGLDHPAVAQSRNNLGALYCVQSDFEKADSLLKSALTIWEKSLGPNHPDLFQGLNNLTVLYWSQGKHAQAEPLLKRCLKIFQTTLGADHPHVAMTLNNLATIYEAQDKNAEAEPLYRQSLSIVEKTLGPDHPHVATCLNNLALIYDNQGKYAEAEPLYERCLAVWEKTLGTDHPNVAAVLSNLASTYYQEGKYPKAEPLIRRALAIEEKAFGSEHPNLAKSLNNLAFLYKAQGKYAEAESIFVRSLIIWEKALGPEHPNVARGLYNLAHNMFFETEKKLARATPLLERAIRILDVSTASPDLRVNAYALRARLRKQMKDPDGATSDLIEALSSLEKLRPQIGSGEEIRAGYFEQYANFFNLMVAWQLEAGQVDKAFEYAERGRARVLLDQFAASNIDLRSSIPAETLTPLEQRETNARTRMAEYRQRLNLLPSRKDFSDEQKDQENAALKDSLRLAEREYQQVYEEIKSASSLWREVITASGQPIDLVTAQNQLVPAKGLLLLYQIGAEESFVFVIPPAAEKAEALPLKISSKAAALLGVKAGPLKADELNKILVGQETNGGLLEQLKFPEIDQQKSVSAKLSALWQMLVPQSLWSKLVAYDEVVIVPDGVLHLLPFEALVVKSGVAPSAIRYWLDEGPVIRYAPSLTTLHNLERRASTPNIPAMNQPVILSVADPIFDLKLVAEAMQAQSLGKSTANQDSVAAPMSTLDSLLVSSATRGRNGLNPLPGTKREAEAVRLAFGSEAVRTLMQLEANEPQLRADLPGKRYVHLATHGIVDEHAGTLFAALALTPPQTTRTTEDDGYLQLHEIYDLKMPRCELAVLSACETNAGRQFEGEGIFALSRGFLVAGAGRVIASHWLADDSSTADLMGDFFKQVAATEKAGQAVDYGRCLRDAKLNVRRKAGWDATHFWAPFILVGKK